MERFKRLFSQSSQPQPEYAPLAPTSDESATLESKTLASHDEVPFSWLEYTIFGFLGLTMLWAWNMFLTASPYFASRLAGDPAAEASFQSAILAVSTINLGTMVVLTKLQHSASYSFRINLALVINCIVFLLLTLSTVLYTDAQPRGYLVFLLLAVAGAAWAAGLIQNGAFALAASFGRADYMQSLMAGQSVAGVLPPIAQIMAVLWFTPKDGALTRSAASQAGESSAFVYFLTAVVISAIGIVIFVPLAQRHKHIISTRLGDELPGPGENRNEAGYAARKTISMWHLFLKLRWLALGVAYTFTATMFFPVFTARIHSVHEGAGSLTRPAVFIPLAFLLWNIGDLSGRIATMLPFSLKRRPFLLFLLALLRTGQLALYFLCNIDGRGALLSSDLFYLLVAQGLFGLTNGWVGASCMMAAADWVEGERKVAGGFMALSLVAGLTAGSLLSFIMTGF